MFENGIFYSDATYYFALYSDGCLRQPPWGEEPFDCFIVNFRPSLPDDFVEHISYEVAAAKNDWVESFGPLAIRLHDAVDAASARIGRQQAVGDGSPMTAWDEDGSIEAVIEHLSYGGLGYQDVKCVLIVGDVDDITRLMDSF